MFLISLDPFMWSVKTQFDWVNLNPATSSPILKLVPAISVDTFTSRSSLQLSPASKQVLNIPNDALIIWAIKNKALLPPLLLPAILLTNLEFFWDSGRVGNSQEFFQMFYDYVWFFFPRFLFSWYYSPNLIQTCKYCFVKHKHFFFLNKTNLFVQLLCAKDLNQDRTDVN